MREGLDEWLSFWFSASFRLSHRFFKPAPSPKPRQKPKILATHRYVFSVNALGMLLLRKPRFHPATKQKSPLNSGGFID
jgi:hypothetical protein